MERPLSMVVIEDHEGLREALTDHFVHAGWPVRSFARVDDALFAIRRDPPDVVLTDINVAEMSGAALARELRVDPATADLVVIAMSGTAPPTHGLLRLFDLYLYKPVDLATLCDTIRQVRATRAARGH